MNNLQENNRERFSYNGKKNSSVDLTSSSVELKEKYPITLVIESFGVTNSWFLSRTPVAILANWVRNNKGWLLESSDSDLAKIHYGDNPTFTKDKANFAGKFKKALERCGEVLYNAGFTNYQKNLDLVAELSDGLISQKFSDTGVRRSYNVVINEENYFDLLQLYNRLEFSEDYCSDEYTYTSQIKYTPDSFFISDTCEETYVIKIYSQKKINFL